MTKVWLLMVAEIDVGTVDTANHNVVTEAQLRLDAFREASVPNDYGISLYRATPDELPHLLGGDGSFVLVDGRNGSSGYSRPEDR